MKGHFNKLVSNIDGVVDEKGICEIFCEQYKSHLFHIMIERCLKLFMKLKQLLSTSVKQEIVFFFS